MLKEELKSIGKTNKDIAKLLDVHVNTVSRKMNYGYLTTVEAEKIYKEYFEINMHERDYRSLFSFCKKSTIMY